MPENIRSRVSFLLIEFWRCVEVKKLGNELSLLMTGRQGLPLWSFSGSTKLHLMPLWTSKREAGSLEEKQGNRTEEPQEREDFKGEQIKEAMKVTGIKRVGRKGEGG